MKKKVAFPFRHHATLVCPEAKQMLLDAGFELVCNDTGEKLSFEEQHAMIADAFAVIAGTERYDAAMLEGCSELKVIIRFGVGTDNFDLETMKKKGIQVGIISNYNAVAEFALTLILATMKNLPLYDAEVRSGGWARYSMRELSYKTVGLMGFGRIGKRLAELLKGFDVKVLAYDPYLPPEVMVERGAEPVSFDELLARSDVVSLHLPATEATRHIINAETIAKMKDGVRILNFARGELVASKDIVDALASGKAGAYITDFPTDEQLGAEGVTALPHLGASTPESEENCAMMAADEVSAYLLKGEIKNSVNLPNTCLAESFAVRTCFIHKENADEFAAKAEAAAKAAGANVTAIFTANKKDMGYTVIDTDKAFDANVEGAIRVRVI